MIKLINQHEYQLKTEKEKKRKKQQQKSNTQMTHNEVQNKKCVTYLCTSHTKHNVLDHFNVCSCREPG